MAWADGRIGLVVFGEELPAESIRAGLARELGEPVDRIEAPKPGAAPSHPYVTVTLRNGELAVTYDEPGRGTVSRVIKARRTAAENAEDAIVLATSLVRNEADELLGRPPGALPTLPGAASGDATPGGPASGAAPPELSPEAAPSNGATPAAPAKVGKEAFESAYVSFFHPLASNYGRPYIRTHFGVNFIYGRAGELDHGLQIGLVNVIAGKPGVASGNVSGVQLAPLFVGFNYASGFVSGLQFSTVGNAAGDGVDGAQIAWAVNVSGGPVRGVQFAPVNVAGDVRGTQLGLLNVAKQVKGLTLGLVNVADDIEGVPVGLISVTKTGGIHPVVWGSTAAYANVGVKFATKHTYTMVAGHYVNDRGGSFGGMPPIVTDARDFVGGGYFVGGRIPFERAYVEIDVGASGLVSTTRAEQRLSDGNTRRYTQVIAEPRLRLIAGYRFEDHLSLFAGIGCVVRARIVNDGDEAVFKVLPEFVGGVQF